MENPLISVIIPCFNHGKYLSEAIESVKSSTLKDWEIVIVNDGSSDNTEEIALSFLSDSRIHYVYQSNGGLPKARNFGISVASGKYILPLDSDDKIAPTYLEDGVSFLNNHPEYTLCYCNVKYFGMDSAIHSVCYSNYKKQLIYNQIVASCIFRKEDWKRIGGYDEKFTQGAEDWEFWIRLLYPDKKAYKIDNAFLFYRQYRGTEEHLSNAIERNRQEVLVNLFSKHFDKYIEFYGAPQQIYLDNEYMHSWADRKLPKMAQKMQRLYQSFVNRIIKRTNG